MKFPARPELSRRAQKLLAIPLGLLLLHFTFLPISAQGSCSCIETGEFLACESDDTCDPGYSPSEDSCPTNLDVGWGCAITASCTCIADSGTPCSDAGGVCLDSCGPDYDSYPPGDVECAPAGRMCCKPADEEEPPEEDGEYPEACTGGCCPTPIGCIPINLTKAGEYLFCIMLDLVALLAVIMFVIGGYQVMTAGDNPETLQEGKGKMTAAITGLIAFLLFAWIIHIILGIEMLAFPIVCNIP